MGAIETIEELFLEEYGHTVKLEHLIAEGTIAITIEGTVGILAEGECDWTADENLETAIERVVIQAMPNTERGNV